MAKMKILIGILVISAVVLSIQTVAAQYQLPDEEQYKQEDRDAYLRGFADGKMGQPPSQNNPALNPYDIDPYRIMRNQSRPDPYLQGYDDGLEDSDKH